MQLGKEEKKVTELQERLRQLETGGKQLKDAKKKKVPPKVSIILHFIGFLAEHGSSCC